MNNLLKFLNPFYWLDLIFKIPLGLYRDFMTYVDVMYLVAQQKNLVEWREYRLRASYFGTIYYVYNVPDTLYDISTDEVVLPGFYNPYDNVPTEIYADMLTVLKPITMEYFVRIGLIEHLGAMEIERHNEPNTYAYIVKFSPNVSYLTGKNIFYTLLLSGLAWYFLW